MFTFALLEQGGVDLTKNSVLKIVIVLTIFKN